MEIHSIKVTCKGAISLPISKLNEFQGELKSLSTLNYEKLKNEIVEMGFSFTVHVWLHQGKYFILDGHQRIRTVKKMISEGWECPELPCSIVEAESYQQAKRKLLGAASSYGKIENDGLLEYLQETDITPDELVSRYDFGTLNVNKFVESNFEGLTGADIETLDSSNIEDAIAESKSHTCPNCKHVFND